MARKLFTPLQGFTITLKALTSLLGYKRELKHFPEFSHTKERIMLTVTQVNGCAMCSYAHTQIALDSGLQDEEIMKLLNAELEDVPETERAIIIFAQHYADTQAKPTKEAYSLIVNTYGKAKAKLILDTIHIIMMGNCYGIPTGSFISRFKKKGSSFHDLRSTIAYELLMFLTLIISLPICLVLALFIKLFRIHLI